jgi:hypothetical protein
MGSWKSRNERQISASRYLSVEGNTVFSITIPQVFGGSGKTKGLGRRKDWDGETTSKQPGDQITDYPTNGLLILLGHYYNA